MLKRKKEILFCLFIYVKHQRCSSVGLTREYIWLEALRVLRPMLTFGCILRQAIVLISEAVSN